jgi:hypothetical protein
MVKKKKKRKIPKSIRKKLQEKKRLQKAIHDSQEKLLKRTMEKSVEDETELLIAPPSNFKMSDIIIKYAKPLLDVSISPKEQEKAIISAIIFWNLSFFPENKRSQCIIDIFGDMNTTNDGGGLSDSNREVLGYMIKRKNILFPDINRMVIDYDYVETPKGFHLNVVSNISKDELNSYKSNKALPQNIIDQFAKKVD